MSLFKVAFIGLLAVHLTPIAKAIDVSGTWVGKIVVEADKATLEKMKFDPTKVPTVSLVLKKDKTYLAGQVGGKANSKVISEGTWKLAGNKLIVTPTKKNGSDIKGDLAKPKTYFLSKDGTTLTMDVTSDIKAASQKRGAKDVPKMTVKVVLHKSK